MSRTALGWMILVLFAAGCAHNVRVEPPDFAELEQQWMNALAEKRMAELEQLLASDFTIVGGGSTAEDLVASRAEWLANALQHPWPNHQVQVAHSRVLGDTAVVHAILRGTYPPQSLTPEGGELTFLITDVWVWRDGRWQVTSRHSTLAK